MSLRPLAVPLAEAVGRPVAFAEDCIGPKARSPRSRSMKDGDVLLLENTRFHAGEEKNEIAFAKALAALGDIYVNDAFSAAHRAHASTEGLARISAVGGGPRDAGRALPSAQSAGKSRAAADGGGGRRQDLDQDRRPHESGRKRGCAGDRRRDGEHVPGRAGLPGRQVAGGTRPARDRTKNHRFRRVRCAAQGFGGGEGIGAAMPVRASLHPTVSINPK